MDADCLIKLTKAGLKDLVCKYCQVSVPEAVKKEVVDAGKKSQCTDAIIVEKNIQNEKITVAESQENQSSGDSALFSLFTNKTYDSVATDDAKLIRRLKAADIPFVLPAIIFYILVRQNKTTIEDAFRSLEKLSAFISADESTSVRMLLERSK